MTLFNNFFIIVSLGSFFRELISLMSWKRGLHSAYTRLTNRLTNRGCTENANHEQVFAQLFQYIC